MDIINSMRAAAGLPPLTDEEREAEERRERHRREKEYQRDLAILCSHGNRDLSFDGNTAQIIANMREAVGADPQAEADAMALSKGTPGDASTRAILRSMRAAIGSDPDDALELARGDDATVQELNQGFVRLRAKASILPEQQQVLDKYLFNAVRSVRLTAGDKKLPRAAVEQFLRKHCEDTARRIGVLDAIDLDAMVEDGLSRLAMHIAQPPAKPDTEKQTKAPEGSDVISPPLGLSRQSPVFELRDARTGRPIEAETIVFTR